MQWNFYLYMTTYNWNFSFWCYRCSLCYTSQRYMNKSVTLTFLSSSHLQSVMTLIILDSIIPTRWERTFRLYFIFPTLMKSACNSITLTKYNLIYFFFNNFFGFCLVSYLWPTAGFLCEIVLFYILQRHTEKKKCSTLTSGPVN